VFHPSRLVLARHKRGLTKAELAIACGVSARSLYAYETGKTSPGPEAVDAIAAALGFPVDFFYRGDAPLVAPEAVSFRALSRMPAKDRDRASADAAIAIELDEWIDGRFTRPAPDVPDLPGFDPTAAAAMVRAQWGLGIKPIRNMIHLLESRGVRVYSLSRGIAADGRPSQTVDALSMWWGETPFIFLSPTATAERARYNAAHELGHLVLHKHGGPSGQQAEREAHAFAGAFLVPSADLRANPPRGRPLLRAIIQAKARWGISALGLVYRMHEEGLLTDWHYKQLCIQIRSLYGSTEPAEGQRESSQVLTKVFAALRQSGSGRRQIAAELALPINDLDGLIDTLVLTPVSGGGGGQHRREKPILRVIE
jgi:Zn-dependent peptidase ImmA (M78 family)/DNA-binding XRE family transcriptional regulator